MSVTQKTIAEKLNISQAHVARALSGRGEVSEETRLKVEAAARELGYNPNGNRGARTLAAQRYGKRVRHNLLAVLLPLSDLGKSLHRSIPFYIPLLQGIEAEAVDVGVDICLCPVRASELSSLVRERNVDGVVVLDSSRTIVDQVLALGLPLVSFHVRYPGAHSVGPDDRDGMRQATRHLLELGHRRIAYLGTNDRPGEPSYERMEGYLDAMREYGVTVPENWIDMSFPLPVARPNVYCAGCGKCAACIGWQSLLSRNGGVRRGAALPFTALVCHNDLVAMGAIAQARQAGIEVPRDLSVVGFDDVSEEYGFTPALTSVNFCGYELGWQTSRLLREVINREAEGHAGGEVMHRVFPVTLSIHDSTRSVAPLRTASRVMA